MATVTFISSHPQLELLRVPHFEKPLPMGNGWMTAQQRVAYKFQPVPDRETGGLVGVLIVKEGSDKLVDSSGWLRDDQEEGIERDAVQALMAHRLFKCGEDDAQEGPNREPSFWLQGHEPGTKYPQPAEFRRTIRLAGVSLDEEKLVEMINEERRTHQRQDLLEDAEGTLEAVRQARAEIDAAAQAEAEKAAKAKPKAKAPA